MSLDPNYKHYVSDSSFIERYNLYQDRYIVEPRESDKVLMQIIDNLITSNHLDPKNLRLLDIGCSTGNLLLHLKNIFPTMNLVGSDLAVSSVDKCKANPNLAGIEFQVYDVLDFNESNAYDFIVTNAVSCLFNYDDYDNAVGRIAKALKPGGWYVAFEWFHPYEQDIEIIERSKSHPDGMKMYFRPQYRVTPIFERHGYASVEYHPFKISVDLPVANAPVVEESKSLANLRTYTVKTEAGERILFRGAIAQPWCHLVARKSL